MSKQVQAEIIAKCGPYEYRGQHSGDNNIHALFKAKKYATEYFNKNYDNAADVYRVVLTHTDFWGGEQNAKDDSQ